MVSSSDSDPRSDERRRRRMLSNRESARRSRARKQRHLEELVQLAARLAAENAEVATRVGAVGARCAALEAGNTVLRTQLAELADRLRSLGAVLRVLQDASGVRVEIPEIPDPLLKPWQLPCPTYAILASAAHAFADAF